MPVEDKHWKVNTQRRSVRLSREVVQSIVDKYYEGDIESIHSEILQALLVDMKFEPKVFEDLGKRVLKKTFRIR